LQEYGIAVKACLVGEKQRHLFGKYATHFATGAKC